MAGDDKSGGVVATRRATLALSVRAPALDYSKRGWSRKSDEGMATTVLESAWINQAAGLADFAIPEGFWVYVFQKSAQDWVLRHELRRSPSGYDAAQWNGTIDLSSHAKRSGADRQPALGSKAYPPNGIPFDPAVQSVVFLSRLRLSHARVNRYLSDASALSDRGTAWEPAVNAYLRIDTQQAARKQYNEAALKLAGVPDVTVATRRMLGVGDARTERCWVPLTEPVTLAEDLRIYQQASIGHRSAFYEDPKAVKLRAYSEMLYDAAKGVKEAKALLEFDALRDYVRDQRSMVTYAEREVAASSAALVRTVSAKRYEAALRDLTDQEDARAYALDSYDFVLGGLVLSAPGLEQVARFARQEDGLLPEILFTSGFQAWRKVAAGGFEVESLFAKYVAGQTFGLTGKTRKKDVVFDGKAALKKVRKRIRAFVAQGVKDGRYDKTAAASLGSIQIRSGGQKSALPYLVSKETGRAVGPDAQARIAKVGGPLRGIFLAMELANLGVAAASLPDALRGASNTDKHLALVGAAGGFADAAGALKTVLEETKAGERFVGTRFGTVVAKGVSFKALSIVGAVCDYVGGVAGGIKAADKGDAGQAMGHGLSALAAVAMGGGSILTAQSAVAGAGTAVAFGLTGPALMAIGAALFVVATVTLWLTAEDPPLVTHTASSPWKEGALAGKKKPAPSSKDLGIASEDLVRALIRYKVSATLTRKTVAVGKQRHTGLSLTLEVSANMLLAQSTFGLSKVTLYRTGDRGVIGDEALFITEALPPGERLGYHEATSDNVRERDFHLKALVSDRSTTIPSTKVREDSAGGIWSVRTRPGKQELRVEVALPFSYSVPSSQQVIDPETRAMRPGDPVTVQQLRPGHLELNWKGKGYHAKVELDAQPPISGGRVTLKTSASTG